jgi:hypothetical protein
MNSAAPHGISKAFQQLAVRQTLQFGVKQTGLIQHIFHGYGTIDDTPLAPMPETGFFNAALKTQPYSLQSPARQSPAGSSRVASRSWRHDIARL